MSAVDPGTPEWYQGVAECKAIESARAWLLGDWALRVFPMGERGHSTKCLENLRAFANEIDCPFDTLRVYRDVSKAWPADKRIAGTSHGAHQSASLHPELLTKGMPLRTVRRLVAEQRASVGSPQRNTSNTPKPKCSDCDTAYAISNTDGLCGDCYRVAKGKPDGVVTDQVACGLRVVRNSTETMAVDHFNSCLSRLSSEFATFQRSNLSDDQSQRLAQVLSKMLDSVCIRVTA